MVLLCLLSTVLAFGDTAEARSPTPTVDGWVIKWADDGWYQVQTADGSKTLCNGGPSCDVKAKGGTAGDYKVINHSTDPKGRWAGW